MRSQRSRKLTASAKQLSAVGVVYLISVALTSSGQQLNPSEQVAELAPEAVHSTVGLAQQSSSAPANAPKYTNGQITSKLGTAPHERPACQLAPLNHHQHRRHNHHHHQQQQSGFLLSGTEDTGSITNATRQPSFATPPGQETGHLLNGRAQLTGRATSKRFDSSERLRQLRQLLASNNYDGYLVTSNDEHGSEYTSDHDRRLKFISGFAGSAGYALILLDRAVLFTDGRYALQADQELDCNWWLVVNTEPLHDIPLWLKTNAANGLKIATDARLMKLQDYDYLEEQLRKQESEFALISQDLVDVVWSNNALEAPRPQLGDEPLQVHPLQFTGNVTWQEKLVRLCDAMSKLRARHYIVSHLDDIAWLLNLRGNDIPQSPLFKAYLLVSRSPAAALEPPANAPPQAPLQAAGSGLQSPQVLQVQPSQSVRVTLYVDLKRIDQQVRDHLHITSNGTFFVQQQTLEQPTLAPSGGLQTGTQPLSTRIQVELKDYEVFIMDIREKLLAAGSTPASAKQQLQGRLLLNANSNVAIHVLAKGHEDRLVLMDGLIMKLKAVKTDGEVQGMRLAHWRDSLAVSMLLAQLEQDIGRRGQVNRWTEVSAAQELDSYRSLLDHYRGESFRSISAYGPNAAIVHYAPDYADERSSPHIGNQSTYLLDCGAQYLDGTTDITRTLHYGEPSAFQRETYTRVLMGVIDMMSLIFDQPARGSYRLNDLLARRHLFELGLDYGHGTGHGIGLYSLVHEAPWLIDNYAIGTNAKRQQAAASGAAKSGPLVHSDPVPLQANMFTSVEPGYYKAGEFGIRLENIVVTQRVNPPAQLASRPNDRQEPPAARSSAAGERQFLRFEPVSLVPFEPKLIKLELLSNRQKTWLNSYNLMVRLRMTQQINYYLNKIRTHQQQQQRVTSTSSRLYQQLLQPQSAQAAPADPTHLNDTLGQYNFLRLEGPQFQEKLEQAHRWVMSKTELISLDIPQSLVAPNSNQQQAAAAANNRSEPGVAAGRKRADEQENGLDSRRLMLVYMASLPFNDQEAGEAVASLQLEMSGRMGVAGEAGAAHLAEGNKCSGFECDLWLLGSLNRPGAAGSREHRQRLAGGDHWQEEGEEEREKSPPGSLFEMFQLNGSGQGGRPLLLPINMWSLIVLGLLVVFQLSIAGLMCRRRRSATSATLCQAPHPTPAAAAAAAAAV